ncbi:MAG: mechanosensitive ion channel domain-containing protein, partial [Chloroflexota bacterium]
MDRILSLSSDIYTWGVLLTITIPLIVIILTEIVNRLQQRGQMRLARAVQNFRELHLPLLATRLIMGLIFGMDNTMLLVRIVETLQLIVLMYSVSQFLDVVTETTRIEPKHVEKPGNVDTTESDFVLPRIWGEIIRIVTIVVIHFIILGSVWRAPIEQVLIGLGIVLLVVGFALQDTLRSFVSGLLLSHEKPFSLGHWVKYGPHEGQVIEMGWRAVYLRTAHRDVVVVPNNLISKDVSVNCTTIEPLHAGFVHVSFSYNHPPNEVKEMLVNAALATQGVVASPRPHARVLGYDYTQFAINYEVKMYTAEYSQIESSRDELLTYIYYASQRYNFTIPHQTTIFYQRNASELESVNDYEELLASLKSISIRHFSEISLSILQQLAHDAVFQSYGLEEQVIGQGDLCTGLYIILTGKVRLTIHHNDALLQASEQKSSQNSLN